ncbi:MAG TPA: winged helix DNA-binding domain-containing protein [Solirubrobacteraceae bacterium]|nr:winged helix DNA-binding domain-containing protein [Solirubrobacteraceae bacterium]
MKWKSVLAWRAQRQHLAERASRRSRLAVAERISGLHAQLTASAELTLWARVAGLKRDDVAQALWKDRALVRTWAMRGTLHLMPSKDLGLWVAAQGALKPRHHVGSWLRHWGLTRKEADAMLDAIPQALDGRELTREELAVEVALSTGIDGLDGKLRGGFGDLLKPAAFRGDLCFAPSEGRNVRFTRPDQWLESWEEWDEDEAVREVTRRYLGVYGPANREALARWFGMTSPAQAGRWLEALGDEAATVKVEGEELVMLAADVDEASAAEPSGVVRLLPAFDHYVVAATRDLDAVVADEHRARVYRPQAWLSPVLLVDGRMVGVWSHECKGERLEVELEPFGRLGRGVRAGLEAEAEALAGFLGGELTFRVR